MARRNRTQRRRQNAGQYGTPAQLLDSRLALRVEEGRIAPATRTVNGTTRYTDPLQSGTPRQMLGKYGLTLSGTSEWAKSVPLVVVGDGSAYTLSGWAKTSSVLASRYICGQWDSTGNNRIAAISLNAGVARFFASADGTSSNFLSIETAATYNDGAWHHYALVFDGGTLTAYIDGALVPDAVVTTGTVSAINTSPALFGVGVQMDGTTNSFSGQIDEVRAWSAVVPAAAIAAIAAMKPGSQSGASTTTKPLIHYKCEESVTSTTLRNSGTLGSVADATITTAAIATVRGTASPVYSFANSVGGTQAYVADGVDDYLDTQIDFSGFTSFTVWRRARQLTAGGTQLDGFVETGAERVRLGVIGDEYYAERGPNGVAVDLPIGIPVGKVHTMSVKSTTSGPWQASYDGIVVDSGTSGAWSTSTLNYLIGGYSITGPAVGPNYSHTEYYEYLIADRVLTDDELTWLETGGQAGTAIDFEGDANILLYTDFSDQTATTIRNHANANLPILKAVGGELTMVPRSESDTTKDVDQADFAYRSALYVAANTTGTADFNAQLIPSSSDFDISLDFNLFAVDATDTDQTILSQHTAATDGRLLLCIEKATLSVQLFVGAADGVTDIDIQSASNTVVAGKWHTARITRVGDVFTLYVDGVQQDTQTLASASIEATDTFLGQSGTLTTHDEFHGLISNIDFGSGQQYLTRPGETISGATLTNASYVDAVRGKPGTIQHTGIAPRDMVLNVPCATWDGIAHLAVAGLSGSETVVSSGGTSTPSISAGRIDFTAGTCWDLLLSNGSKYVFCEYSGATAYDVVNGDDGTITGATLATLWQSNTQNASDTLVTDGYAIASGANVPAMQDGSGLAANGAAIAYGPGVLPPGCSLDLYCGEDDAPISQLLAIDLTDGDYAFGDGDEGDALFKRGDANSEQIAVINPAATGVELAALQNWST